MCYEMSNELDRIMSFLPRMQVVLDIKFEGETLEISLFASAP